MLRRLDVHELRDWAAYERIEPFVAERIDYGFTKLECVIRSALGEKAVSLKKFLPDWYKDGSEVKAQSPDQIGATFDAIRKAMQEAKRGA